MTPVFHLVGDAALSVEWPLKPCANGLARILKLQLEANPLVGVLETLPALRNLLVRYDPLVIDPASLEQGLRDRLKGLKTESPSQGRRMRIPVCYDADFGPDIETLVKTKQMSPADLIALHTGADYTAMFLGFLPGFAYLGGLPERLHAPRLQTPRTFVPAGSVALADNLSAIYPLESPGGWHVIGRTPLKLFDLERADPFLLAPGDSVSFFAIDRAEYDRLNRRQA